MNHKNFITVKQMNVDELFNEAKFVHKLSFNKFAEFIKQELDNYHILRTKNADPARFLGKENELRDYNGVKLYFDVKEMVKVENGIELGESQHIIDLGFDQRHYQQTPSSENGS